MKSDFFDLSVFRLKSPSMTQIYSIVNSGLINLHNGLIYLRTSKFLMPLSVIKDYFFDVLTDCLPLVLHFIAVACNLSEDHM